MNLGKNRGSRCQAGVALRSGRVALRSGALWAPLGAQMEMAAGAPAFVPTDPPWTLVDNQGRLHVVTSREHLHDVGRESTAS